MSSFLPIFAETASVSELLPDGDLLSPGTLCAGFIFLLCLCAGVALNIALLVYLMKRPPRLASWCEALRVRALPGRQLLLLGLVLMTGYIGCAVVYHILFPSIGAEDPSPLTFQGLFFNIPALLLIGWVLVRGRTAEPEPMGVRWRRGGRLFGLSVLLYLAVFPILWCYSLLYQFFLEQMGYEFYMQGVAELFLAPMTLSERVMMVVTAVVLAPIFEEFFFRGVLLPWVVRRLGFWPGIVLVSLLFATIHMHLPSMLPLFLFAVLLSLAYARTRSLLVPIGMHACFNAVSTLMIMLTGGG